MRPVKIGGQLHPNPLDQVYDYTSGGGNKNRAISPRYAGIPATVTRSAPLYFCPHFADILREQRKPPYRRTHQFQAIEETAFGGVAQLVRAAES